MAFDQLIQKYFAVPIAGLTVLVAYYQASGVSQLLGALLLAPPAASTGAKGPRTTAELTAQLGAPEESRRDRSGSAILSRNPFDSVTGPLDAKPLEDSLPTPTHQAPDLSDPLSASACEGINVLIVTESHDPLWSLAAIQGPGESAPKMRRIGDDVGGRQVAYIGYNPREATPSVWFEGGPQLCQAMLFRKGPPAAAAPTVSARPAAGPAAKGAPSALQTEIASKIQRVSDTEFNVDRAVVDKILENQAELMKSARIVPEQENGKVVGIRMFGIRPDSLLGKLGIQNGDRLESINGFNMASPEKALEAYARLRTASNLSVKVTRRGAPVTIDFHIK